MQVYKLTLSYTYYAVQIGAAEYMIIGYTDLAGLQNGFALGSLIDEVEPSEVEPCGAALSDFDFCQTHIFQTFLKLEEGKEMVRLEIEAARQQMAEEIQPMLDMLERERYDMEQADQIVKNMDTLINVTAAMRSSQNLYKVRACPYAKQVDAAISNYMAQMARFKREQKEAKV